MQSAEEKFWLIVRDKLMTYRRATGVTAAQLARQLEKHQFYVTPGTLSRWLSGARAPARNSQLGLLAALDSLWREQNCTELDYEWDKDGLSVRTALRRFKAEANKESADAISKQVAVTTRTEEVRA